MKKHQPASKNGQKRGENNRNKKRVFFVTYPSPYPLSSSLVSFRHGSDASTPVACSFCDCTITAAHFWEDCQDGDMWAAVLYTRLASALRRIAQEWGVSLPTFWGVLIQWGGAYNRCRFYLHSARSVSGYFVHVRPHVTCVTCIRKSADSSWSDPQTSTHCFGH